jgi:hypothetical protein
VWDASDEALLAGFATGDPDAAGAFVRRFQHRVLGLASLITHDAADAEEVAQDAFLRAWRYAASRTPPRRRRWRPGGASGSCVPWPPLPPCSRSSPRRRSCWAAARTRTQPRPAPRRCAPTPARSSGTPPSRPTPAAIRVEVPDWAGLVNRYGATVDATYWLAVEDGEGQRALRRLPPADEHPWTVELDAVASTVAAVSIVDNGGTVWCTARFE